MSLQCHSGTKSIVSLHDSASDGRSCQVSGDHADIFTLYIFDIFKKVDVVFEAHVQPLRDEIIQNKKNVVLGQIASAVVFGFSSKKWRKQKFENKVSMHVLFSPHGT